MSDGYFKYPFAISGDKTTVPDPTQVSGSVSYQSGWPLDYQKILGTDPDALPIGRSQTNQLLYDITLGLKRFQEFGAYPWITTAQNDGVAFPYAKNAIAGYDDGVAGYNVYQSLIAANTNPPSTGGVTHATWRNLSLPDSPIGQIIDFGGTSLQANHLACDGSAVSRTTYAGLFTAIGTTWGVGDGSTTFNLPDFRRRGSVGSGGAGTGVLGSTVGSNGGEETHTQTIAEMPNHNHPGSTITAGVGAGNNSMAEANPTVQEAILTIASQGGGNPFNIIQPSLVVYKQIRYA